MNQTLIAAAVAFAIGAGFGWNVNGWRLESGYEAEKRESAEMTLSTEREVRRAVDTITVNNQKEKARAKATIDSLRADVRNGTERLSVAVQSCQARDSSTGNTEARAELMPEAAERIVVIAGEANEAVRELNECIDKYEAVKGK